MRSIFGRSKADYFNPILWSNFVSFSGVQNHTLYSLMKIIRYNLASSLLVLINAVFAAFLRVSWLFCRICTCLRNIDISLLAS